ncbi:flavin reductase family protein [Paenibacillus sp. GCM10012306]|uniref:flavin reductase family protein n=1 Tax=Paenibacillus sp. GCM10012306 TaxID=3317342 RepID=UPI003610AA6D
MEGTAWRSVMGKFATGVTVITTLDEAGQPIGMTANAFTSLSLEPSLLIICLDKGSSTLVSLLAARKFAVNFLADTQEDLSRCFARKSETDKFAEIDYREGELGLPILGGCLASVECRLADTLDGGDHLILVGQGEFLYESETQASPLLFYQGKYRALQALEG